MINAGDKFNFKGFEWIALKIDNGFVLSMMAKPWKSLSFNENGGNNWEKSSLRKVLNSELLPLIGEENLCEGITDLTADNGNTAYGNCLDFISILSCDEFRKHREIIMENYDFDDEWMWTLTPNVAYGYYTRYLDPSGTLNHSSAMNAYGVAPVCGINLAALESKQANDKEINSVDKILGQVDCMCDCLAKIWGNLCKIKEIIKGDAE